MKYQFIRRHRLEFSVKRMCRVLELSISGFYAWLKRRESRRKREDAQLLQAVRRIYEASRGTYGSPRIHRALKEEGWRIGEKRVALLMRRHDMRAHRKQGYKRVGRSSASVLAAPNILDRNFEAKQPNRKWLADMIQIATEEGWLHLAAVMDTFSRTIVGWSMATHKRSEVAQDALKMAIARRQPADDLLHHSDLGSQYTDKDYRQLLTDHRITCSMSAAGSCYDNAMMESFFATLKVECARQKFATMNEARLEIFSYIEAWYNRRRRHSALEYLSPMEYELRKV